TGLSPWNTAAPQVLPRVRSGFNGATGLSPWNTRRAPRRPGHRPAASMGPRVFHRGTRVFQAPDPGHYGRLQWGHGSFTVEHDHDLRLGGNPVAASMGPRVFHRGTQ